MQYADAECCWPHISYFIKRCLYCTNTEHSSDIIIHNNVLKNALENDYLLILLFSYRPRGTVVHNWEGEQIPKGAAQESRVKTLVWIEPKSRAPFGHCNPPQLLLADEDKVFFVETAPGTACLSDSVKKLKNHILLLFWTHGEKQKKFERILCPKFHILIVILQ